jgi:hypothetical protein
LTRHSDQTRGRTRGIDARSDATDRICRIDNARNMTKVKRGNH